MQPIATTSISNLINVQFQKNSKNLNTKVPTSTRAYKIDIATWDEIHVRVPGRVHENSWLSEYKLDTKESRFRKVHV